MKTIFNTITFIIALPFLLLFLISTIAIGLIDNDTATLIIGKSIINAVEKSKK